MTLLLPRASAPAWFVPELVLNQDSTFVILDDDATIHHIWTKRWDNEGFSQKSPISPSTMTSGRLLHFSTRSQLSQWFRSNPLLRERDLFLIDFEFLGQKMTGLDIIEELGIEKHSILVTSRYEDQAVRQRHRLRCQPGEYSAAWS